VEQVVVQLNLVNASISLERDGSLKTLRLVDVCCSVIVDLLSLKILHGGCMGFLKKVSLLTATLFFLLCAHGNAMQLQENNQMTESKQNHNMSQVVPDGFVPAPPDLLETLSPGEKKWFQRFQEGVPLFSGWKKITQAVVEKFPENERDQRMAIMRELGLKIGSEWSRDDHIRKVDTDMLRLWGKELRQAGSENHLQIAKVMFKIEREVNSLLQLEQCD